MARDPRTCPYFDLAARHAARIVSTVDLPAEQRDALQAAIERAMCDAWETGRGNLDTDTITAEVADLRPEDFDG